MNDHVSTLLAVLTDDLTFSQEINMSKHVDKKPQADATEWDKADAEFTKEQQAKGPDIDDDPAMARYRARDSAAVEHIKAKPPLTV